MKEGSRRIMVNIATRRVCIFGSNLILACKDSIERSFDSQIKTNSSMSCSNLPTPVEEELAMLRCSCLDLSTTTLPMEETCPRYGVRGSWLTLVGNFTRIFYTVHNKSMSKTTQVLKNSKRCVIGTAK